MYIECVENSEIICEESIGNGRLTYKIISTLVQIEGKNVKVFGIEIVSTLFGEKEIAYVKDLGSDFENVREFYRALIKNSALPSSLQDISIDWLA